MLKSLCLSTAFRHGNSFSQDHVVSLRHANPDELRINVKRNATRLFDRVSGQRPEQGAAAKFYAQHKTWAPGPYPAQ